MAARNMFEAFTASLPERDRESLSALIATRRTDMLAARSEEARVRIAEEFIRDAKTSLKGERK